MSKLSEYSKFDHLDDDDSDEEQTKPKSTNEAVPDPPEAEHPSAVGVTKQGSSPGRYIFEFNGQKIYEWEQSLEEVNIYVDAPPGVEASQLVCHILPDRLRLGLKDFVEKQGRFFIDEVTFSKVNTTESSWYLDDSGVINIVLIKAHRGETWESALRGREQSVNPFTKQQMQKQLMLERFQEENPGMDFRGAEFNGEVPDPRSFMGGCGYR